MKRSTEARHLHVVPSGGWDLAQCDELIAELTALREAMLAHERQLAAWIDAAQPSRRASARNLAHYLAMRGRDLRATQEGLARLGLSSLGRGETHVLANLDKVLGLLHVLTGRRWDGRADEEPSGFGSGRERLAQHGSALFGPPQRQRRVRIMVTLPSEAAGDAALVRRLVKAGMDVARINCAHDDARAWAAMAAHVRGAAATSGRAVQVLMDLAGPKIRTGPIGTLAPVLKVKPARDGYGNVVAPARIALRPTGSLTCADGVQAHVDVDPDWFAQLQPGDRIVFTDARGSSRRFTVADTAHGIATVATERTAYLVAETRLRLERRDARPRETAVAGLPSPPARVHVERGHILRVSAPGTLASAKPKGKHPAASVSCTLPAVLQQVRPGERVWFDDGRIGGTIRRVTPRGLDVEITDVADGGAELGADKGINFPDTALNLPALTDKDLADLDVVARHADLVGLSFAQSAEDVRSLRRQLDARGAGQLGLLLKVETRRGFEHLPEMLFAAMGAAQAGVMIARGDLAVECGFERLAEVQEEILWACEAAHMPVVWATQVLETLAKTGQPSRAEITDAAMGERAECVMLNKGPHILEAIHTLDDVLRRMQEHQSKKRPLLRALKAWDATRPDAA
jgi:pyruvate kinase